MECYVCHREYQADPVAAKAWAESGRAFEPTDWVCPRCIADLEAYETEREALERAHYEALASQYETLK